MFRIYFNSFYSSSDFKLLLIVKKQLRTCSLHNALKKLEINKKSPWLSVTAWAGNSLNCELQDGRYFVCQFQDGRHQCLGITRWPPILFGNFEMAAIIV